MLDTLEEWLAIDSTTGREADFLRTIEARLAELGLECERQPIPDQEERWNLIARATPEPSLLFSTHVDTVPPHLEVRRDGETIYGRGACDTKGGLLAMVRAAENLLEEGYDDFGFLLVVGEEVDHRGAREAQSLDLQAERIILCEPTRNRVISGQKGMIKVEIAAEGRAAHSAFPQEGVSAIHRLLGALGALRSADWPLDDELGPTTLNVGTISGGAAANVTAPSARAEVLLRTVSPSGPLLERIAGLAGPEVTVEPVAHNDPVRFDPPADVETGIVPFNTDASYLQGIAPIWLVGPGDIRVAHSDDERITRQAIRRGIRGYEDLARRVIG